MYGKLPSEIVSKFGYQGCLASLDVNGEAVDPIKNVLVPSQHVSEGCEGNNLTQLYSGSYILPPLIPLFKNNFLYFMIIHNQPLPAVNSKRA